MRYSCKLWIVFFALFCFAGSASGTVRVIPSETVEKPVSVDEERMERARGRIARNRAKYERRLNRLERKLEKRGLTGEEQEQDIWNDDKFRLGLLLLLVAIGLGIIGAIISLAGLFSFMAGLFALAGIVLLVWSLVENYG